MATAASVPSKPTRPRSAATPVKDGLRQRALSALQAAVAQAVDSASDDTLHAIIGAAGDPARALAVAPRDLAPAPPERLVAEHAARVRAAQFRCELADRAGGMYARADVAAMLGITAAAVDKQRQRGGILGVSYGNEIRFPAAQFRDGATVPGLRPILAALGGMNPWGQLQLLVAPLAGFGAVPASVLDLLAGAVDEDVRARLVALARGWAA